MQDDTAYGCYPANQLTVPPIVQRLDQLIPSVQGNPDFLLTLPEFPRIALESPSASGGKFWLGVAMENAEEQVKKAADYITGTNEEEGAAKAIEKFVL